MTNLTPRSIYPTSEPPTGQSLSSIPIRMAEIAIGDLIIDQRLQMRTNGLDEEHITRLQAGLEDNGTIGEPIVVFEAADRTLWLADGFHRIEAHQRSGVATIVAKIRQGEFEDARVYAEEANLRHGLNLTNEDKKQIFFSRIERGFMTKGICWDQLSDAALASELGVHRITVSRWFEEYTGRANVRPIDRSVVYGRDGKRYETEAIAESNRRRVQDSQCQQPVDTDDGYFALSGAIEQAMLDAETTDDTSTQVADSAIAPTKLTAKAMEDRRRTLSQLSNDQLDAMMKRVGSQHPDYDIALLVLQHRLSEKRRERYTAYQNPSNVEEIDQEAVIDTVPISPARVADNPQVSSPFGQRPHPRIDVTDSQAQEVGILRKGRVEQVAFQLMQLIGKFKSQFCENRSIEACMVLPESDIEQLAETLLQTANHCQQLLGQIHYHAIHYETYELIWDALEVAFGLVTTLYHNNQLANDDLELTKLRQALERLGFTDE